MLITSRWYQEEAEASLYKYFSEKRGNPVLALPTGTGKSIVIANICRNILRNWPNQRIMMLTHVKELIEQNAKKLMSIWPQAPLGIYSAGLGLRNTSLPIVYGGVASVVGNIAAFGHRDILIIDECHLVSGKDDSLYSVVIKGLKEINPKLKVIGLSATPYRLGQGLITEGGIFTDICYDLTNVDNFNRLIVEGYLAPLIPKKTNIELDVSGVGMSKGDYKQGELQAAVDKESITRQALIELLSYSGNRKCGLIFATGIEHADHIGAMLSDYFNQPNVVIHSKKGASDNKDGLEAWQAGRVKWAVSMNSLTTGVDTPQLDVIGMLRPTASPGLWVQMLGRGTRPAPGKQNCLVMDFAGNTRNLGPINDPRIPRKKGAGTGDAPVRICDACGCYNHASVRFCANCGEEFDIRIKYKGQAGTDELLSDGAPKVDIYPVTHVTYSKHVKEPKPPVMRVTYYCGVDRFNEWFGFEGNTQAKHFAKKWWHGVHTGEPPETVDDALSLVSELRAPRKIRVWTNKQPYPEVLGHEY